ncbi:hypothetical protein GCM10010112_59560 [Actinoplanes lobatus]|nr:hypothetical protein GCM10010112_59560 [Actinoplanes lobatus]
MAVPPTGAGNVSYRFRQLLTAARPTPAMRAMSAAVTLAVRRTISSVHTRQGKTLLTRLTIDALMDVVAVRRFAAAVDCPTVATPFIDRYSACITT